MPTRRWRRRRALPGGRAGFDIHPSFNAEPQRLAAVSNFVDSEFLPQLKALALCQGGILCRNPRADRMTFVDAIRPRSPATVSAPAPRAIRNSIGNASRRPATALIRYRHVGEPADAVRPQRRRISRLLPRARWIRDANDSYFAAMTYPQGLPSSMQPNDIHDATWGVFRRSMAAPCIRAPKATPRWRTPPSRRSRRAAARCGGAQCHIGAAIADPGDAR